MKKSKIESYFSAQATEEGRREYRTGRKKGKGRKELLNLFAFFAFFASIAILPSPSTAQEIILKNGMTFKKSADIDSSHYKLNSKKKNKPVLTVQGNNIILDFKGATLQGSNDKDLPDQFYGTAINIKKGKNITIRNLKIRGYRTAIDAKNIEGLKLENCDFSNNYRRPVENFSDFYQKQSQPDFSIHSQLVNTVVLNGCTTIEISSCSARANENVIAFVNCSDALVVNNDFSFNSGAALVLNGSSNNQVLYNRFNFNISDTLLLNSASVVIDGNTSSSLLYKNSITHSANGIIIGGKTFRKNATPSTRNIIMENDLSYSFFSGISSYNTDAIINKNRIYGSKYGSRNISPEDQLIGNNQFRYNQTAINVDGPGTVSIHHNIFFEDFIALRLQNRKNLKESQLFKVIVVANSFNRNKLVFDMAEVDSMAEFTNIYQQCDTLFKPESAQTQINMQENEDVLVNLSQDLVPAVRVDQTQNPFKGNGRFAGRNFLIPGKWGPYDFSYPLARVQEQDSTGAIRIMVVGPEGEWVVKEIRGYEVLSVSGKEVPGILTLKKNGEENRFLKLEFKGHSTQAIPIGFSPPGWNELNSR